MPRGENEGDTRERHSGSKRRGRMVFWLRFSEINAPFISQGKLLYSCFTWLERVFIKQIHCAWTHHKSRNSPFSQWSETAGSRAEPVPSCCCCKQRHVNWKKLIQTNDSCVTHVFKHFTRHSWSSKVYLGYLTLICFILVSQCLLRTKCPLTLISN